MGTIREFISTVRNSLDSITTDNYISGEYIYTVGLSYSKLFTKRESDSRKIFNNTSMFTFKDCIPMKEVPAVECSSDFSCKKMMRSVEKLPELYLSNYGSLIVVYNLEGDKKYNQSNPYSYTTTMKQRFKPKSNGYFFIKNDYLWIPDSEVEFVSAMFLSPTTGTSALTTANGCKILDQTFPILDYLEMGVLESVVKHISTRMSITRDENDNLDERT